MNSYQITCIKNAKGQTARTNTVQMYLTPEADNGALGEVFRVLFEVEMLRGTRNPDPRGGTHYSFEVDDEKGEMLPKWLTEAYFTPNKN